MKVFQKLSCRKTNPLSKSFNITMQRQPYSDYRCEFEIPKFYDLNDFEDDYRFSSLLTQRSTNHQPIQLKEQRSKSPHADLKQPIINDPFFDWFQEVHDFKIQKPVVQTQKQGRRDFSVNSKRNTCNFSKPELNTSLNQIKKQAIQQSNINAQQCKKRKADEANISKAEDLGVNPPKKIKNNESNQENSKQMIVQKQNSVVAEVEKRVNHFQQTLQKVVSIPKINFIEKNKMRIRELSDQTAFRINNKTHSNETSNLDSSSSNIIVNEKQQIDTVMKKIRPKTQNKENYQAQNIKPQVVIDAKQNLTENFNHLNISNQNSNFQKGKSFLYEPALFSQRIIKQWENKTGKHWYELSPAARIKANQEIQQIALQNQQAFALNSSAFQTKTLFKSATTKILSQ